MAATPMAPDWDSSSAGSIGRSVVDGWRARWRTVAAAVGIGALMGVFVGGIGGRLAMRLLFLTSDPDVAGVVSDDGFVIGRTTAATGFLLLTGLFLGVIGSLLYLGLRPFLPRPPRMRHLGYATLAGVGMSPLLIHPNSVDYTVLSPRWLSVTLFVAIPALYGLLTSRIIDWALRPGGFASTAPTWLLVPPLLLILIPGPPLLVAGVPVAAVIALQQVAQRSSRFGRIVRHSALHRTVQAALILFALVAGADLIRRVVAIL